eukprot:jgi/Mesen1/6173/ME000318S05290
MLGVMGPSIADYSDVTSSPSLLRRGLPASAEPFAPTYKSCGHLVKYVHEIADIEEQGVAVEVARGTTGSSEKSSCDEGVGEGRDVGEEGRRGASLPSGGQDVGESQASEKVVESVSLIRMESETIRSVVREISAEKSSKTVHVGGNAAVGRQQFGPQQQHRPASASAPHRKEHPAEEEEANMRAAASKVKVKVAVGLAPPAELVCACDSSSAVSLTPLPQALPAPAARPGGGGTAARQHPLVLDVKREEEPSHQRWLSAAGGGVLSPPGGALAAEYSSSASMMMSMQQQPSPGKTAGPYGGGDGAAGGGAAAAAAAAAAYLSSSSLAVLGGEGRHHLPGMWVYVGGGDAAAAAAAAAAAVAEGAPGGLAAAAAAVGVRKQQAPNDSSTAPASASPAPSRGAWGARPLGEEESEGKGVIDGQRMAEMRRSMLAHFGRAGVLRLQALVLSQEATYVEQLQALHSAVKFQRQLAADARRSGGALVAVPVPLPVPVTGVAPTAEVANEVSSAAAGPMLVHGGASALPPQAAAASAAAAAAALAHARDSITADAALSGSQPRLVLGAGTGVRGQQAPSHSDPSVGLELKLTTQQVQQQQQQRRQDDPVTAGSHHRDGGGSDALRLGAPSPPPPPRALKSEGGVWAPEAPVSPARPQLSLSLGL